jgi:hypothetical protein
MADDKHLNLFDYKQYLIDFIEYFWKRGFEGFKRSPSARGIQTRTKQNKAKKQVEFLAIVMKGGAENLVADNFLIIDEIINKNFTKHNQEVYKCQVL